MAFTKLTDEQKAEREAQKKAAKEEKARLQAAEREAAKAASGTASASLSEEVARMNLENAQRLARLQSMQIEETELGLELKREQISQLKVQREQKSRANRQRQAQFEGNRRNKLNLMNECLHKQGGDPSSPWTTGDPRADSTVGAILMPDGFTIMVHCALCRGEWFNPHPLDGARALRPNETPEQRDARLERFAKDKADFDRIYALTKDKKSREARQPMSCGASFTITDMETGLPVLRRRPHEMNLALPEAIAQQRAEMAGAAA